MNDDYLWDKSGEADREVERLERALAPLRYPPRALATASRQRAPLPRFRRFRPVIGRIAAALAIVAPLQFLLWKVLDSQPSPNAITVEALDGTAQVGSDTLGAGSKVARVTIGQWVETVADSGRARLELAHGIGTVDLEPGTRLRVVANRGDQQRLDLARGAIHARVDAPPRIFLVDTAAATATDLGCAYRLAAAADGRGTLTVEIGWVALDRDGRSVMVPAGSVCEVRPKLGPGTPHDSHAPADWLATLARFDFEGGGETALRTVLAGARPSDAISLWNLLARVDGPLRGEIFDRLAVLAPLPPGVTRSAALALQTGTLDLWRLAIVPHAFASNGARPSKLPFVDEPAPPLDGGSVR